MSLEYDLWIFDADDTLRRTTVPGQPCPHREGEWMLLPGVAERLRRVPWDAERGPWFGIASNQDRVGYGLIEEATARALLRALARDATGMTPPDRALQLCPHPLGAGCSCRKPQPGMLLRIMEFYDVQPARTVFVGNCETDRQAAVAAGVTYRDAAEFFSSSVAPYVRRTPRTPPRRGADSYDAASRRGTRG